MNIRDYYRLAPLADLLGVPRQTLQKAVARGELPSAELGDGLSLVRLSDAREWKKQFGGRPRGRPPKKKNGEGRDQ